MPNVVLWSISGLIFAGLLTCLFRGLIHNHFRGDRIKPVTNRTSSKNGAVPAGTGFVGKLHGIIAAVRKMSVEIAVESSRMLQKIHDSSEKARAQVSQSDALLTESQEATKNILSGLGRVDDQMVVFQSTVDKLEGNSETIQKVVSLIEGIANQTNLLALNAAVEAARAGEAGAGFAVVAQEVRNLAHRVTDATREISDTIHALQGNVTATTSATETIRKEVGDARKTAHQSAETIISSVDKISQLGNAVQHNMKASEEISKTLQRRTESLQEAVTHISIGRGNFERVIKQAMAFRDQIQAKMADIHQSEIDIFDRNYQKIPNTNPVKYKTVYCHRFDNELQSLFDQALASFPNAAYATCVDVNGYLPTHNSRYQHPLTGDYDADLLQSRDKRMYSNVESEIRRAKNTRPFLLQTYLRDTGEILSEFSLPITIGGKHWGGFLVGMEYQELLAD